MSYFLYNSLSKKYKSELLTVTSNKIVLANNQEIQIDGIATITGIIEGIQTSFDVYVLKDTSHSLLLGTEYLRPNGVILNFNSLSVNFSKSKLVFPKRLNFPPNSESIVWGKVPQYVCWGFQGVCSGSSIVTKKRVTCC
jgi:hypothetical protein